MSGDYLIHEYGGLRIAWEEELAGGGRAFARDFVRLVDHLFGTVGRLCEFCAGPGFVGFALLADGYCDQLVLSDVNPRAIAAIHETIRINELQDKVTVYESDGLDSIPSSEQWDLVVAAPPQFPAGGFWETTKLITDDPEWRLHHNFYGRIKEFLAPGGSVLIQEHSEASTSEDFLAMIADGGLEHVRTLWHMEGCAQRWPNLYYMWIKQAMPGMVLDDGPTMATVPLRDPVDGRVEGPAGRPLSLRLVNETGRPVAPQLVNGSGTSMLWLPLDHMPAGTDLQLPLLGLRPAEYEVRDTTQEVTVARFVAG